MARQVPPNSTPIANNIIEKLALSKLTMYETRIIMAVIRKTYGWDKKKDWITGSQLGKLTGIRQNHCYKTVETLVEKQILIKDGKRIGLNKRTNQWLVHEGVVHEGVVHQDVVSSTSACSQVVHQDVHTKETITKETIQKKKYIKKKTYIPTQKLVETFNHDFELLKLTNEEMDKLHKKFGGELQANLVKFENAMGSRKDYQKKYSSHYRTMLNWYDKPKTKEFYEKEANRLAFPVFWNKHGEDLANKYFSNK